MAIAILMPSAEPRALTGRVMRWLRREGEFVEAGEPVAEIATARATMDVEAPESGVLSRILVAAGESEIAVAAELAWIEPGPAAHRPTEVASGLARVGRKIASPRARRLAREAGVDLSGVVGGGPRGRVVESDIRAAIEIHAHGVRTARMTGAAPSGRLLPLMEAAEWTPQVHLEADCRIDALEVFRAGLNARARAEHRTKISLLDCVVKALALALRQAPRANVALTPKGYELARHVDIALGLTLDGEIVAPSLPAAEEMSLAEIAAARAAFLARRFAPDAFAGGNCLVANLGGFGVKRAFPVVVAPWTSVLGVGAAEKRIVAEQGAPAVATLLAVTLSIDRRAMDEAVAGAALAAFKGLIEHPAGLAD
ncbi:2-oxo acid dehydrogenase subunit E2 [Rhodoblastus sp.]|uniref:2-oxo acid dehydrogenase subunit E2 n=1 Tax=Rhodoblastus sp. TaxID=1962975 RepID=UPI0035B310C7